MNTLAQLRTNTSTAASFALSAAAVILAGSLVGCRGDREDAPPRQFFPDLDDAPKWKPQTGSEFFADGRSMRQPVVGTVALGSVAGNAASSGEAWAKQFSQERANLLQEDGVLYTGKNADGTFVVQSPVKFTKEDLLRGQARYTIYCGVCHGTLGDGKGMVGSQWSYAVPSYHDPKYLDPKQQTGQDGYVFHVARYGVPGGTAEAPDYVKSKMPGYAHALSVEDTWRIVGYVRTLQATRLGAITDAPDVVRDRIERRWREIEAEEAAAKAKAGAPANAPSGSPAPAAPNTAPKMPVVNPTKPTGENK